MRYCNKGGPWRRASGVVLASGEEFEPTEQEEARMSRRHLIGTRFIPVRVHGDAMPVTSGGRSAERDEAPAVAEEETVVADTTTPATEAEDAGEREAVLEPWPLKMAPALYLQMHPEGPRAALARQHVAAVGAAHAHE